VTTARAAAPAGDTATAMLQALAAELAPAGLATRMHAEAGRPPALRVSNPAAPALTERICAGPDQGTWTYWWSWAEPIDPDPARAAAAITRALRARDTAPAT
jgi:hypothetical protein